MGIYGEQNFRDFNEFLRKKKSFEGRVYSDEPIIKKASSLNSYVPDKIKEMKEIKGSGKFYPSKEETFYLQARFMEDYEDDFYSPGEFNRPFPTYEDMSVPLLRKYFTWRTKVREGRVEKTSFSFVLIYLYEFIHLIGFSDAEKAYREILRFSDKYRAFDSEIDIYLKKWLPDFIIYHNLSPAMLENYEEAAFDKAALKLKNFEGVSLDEFFNAISYAAGFSVKCGEKYLSIIKKSSFAVYKNLSNYYGKHRKNSLFESIFGNAASFSYSLFYSAVFFDYKKYESFQYIVNGAHIYSCKNGSWSLLKYYGNRIKKKELYDILDAVTEYVGILSGEFSERKTELPKYLEKIVINETEKCFKEFSEAEKRRVKIDFSSLSAIRKSADEICECLMTWEERENSPLPEKDEDKQESSLLTKEEKIFLKAILKGEKIKNSTLLADSVNEKLFSLFSDTVIDFEEDLPFIIEDYEDGVKGLIL